MSTVILHVGTHKTGSTSIQKTLGHFRAQLLQEGVSLYEGTNHTDFYRAFTDVPESFHQYYRGWRKKLRRDKVRGKIKKYFAESKCSQHLITAEDLSLLSRDSLSEMRRFLMEECGCSNVHAVCVIREPLEYLNSSLQQFIKPGMTSLHDFLFNDFANYRLQGCPDFHGGMQNILMQLYFPIPERLISAFGAEHVTFHRFDSAVRHGLTRTLLESVLLGKAMGWLKELRYNESMSHEACLLLGEYNDRNPLFTVDYRLNKRRNREKCVVPLLRQVPGRKPQFIDPKCLDLGQLNNCIVETNAMTGKVLMTELDPVALEKASPELLEFSSEALSYIEARVGHEEMPLPVADAKLSVEDISRISRLMEDSIPMFSLCGVIKIWRRVRAILSGDD